MNSPTMIKLPTTVKEAEELDDVVDDVDIGDCVATSTIVVFFATELPSSLTFSFSNVSIHR